MNLAMVNQHRLFDNDDFNINRSRSYLKAVDLQGESWQTSRNDELRKLLEATARGRTQESGHAQRKQENCRWFRDVD